MASETFVSAMMLITAVVASAILITAVFPIVWNMVSTFSSASHETDTRMRTDFKIITTHASEATQVTKIWIKNIGSTRIGKSEIEDANVFVGKTGLFDLTTRTTNWPLTNPTDAKKWNYYLSDSNGNDQWDTGETLEVDAISNYVFLSGDYIYFQFVLPNGVFRSTEFTASD